MRPLAYFNLRVRDVAGDDITSHDILSRAFHVLHGAFGGEKGKYAVAFPRAKAGSHRTMGEVIRVFASSADDLYRLIERVRHHHVMRDFISIDMPSDVPANYSGRYVSYYRIRLIGKDGGTKREENLRLVKENPFMDIRSSSGHSFPLRIMIADGSPQVSDCAPSSYGLASRGDERATGNIFSVPDIGL